MQTRSFATPAATAGLECAALICPGDAKREDFGCKRPRTDRGPGRFSQVSLDDELSSALRQRPTDDTTCGIIIATSLLNRRLPPLLPVRASLCLGHHLQGKFFTTRKQVFEASANRLTFFNGESGMLLQCTLALSCF